jgi:hypothetical protein
MVRLWFYHASLFNHKRMLFVWKGGKSQDAVGIWAIPNPQENRGWGDG